MIFKKYRTNKYLLGALVIGIILSAIPLTAQEQGVKDDIVVPSSVGQEANVNGLNLSTGKVNLSLPITNIKSRMSAYPLALNYDGASGFDQGQMVNRFEPTGYLGVGWNILTPRIVVDNKNTGTREDDDFSIEGSFSSVLQCVGKNELPPATEGEFYWEFEPLNFEPVKIRYYFYRQVFINFQWITQVMDYWEIIDENGVIYRYGSSDNSRESIITWNNWIGDSSDPTNATIQTTHWNLSEIINPFNDKISFEYLKIERGVNTWGPEHTEASYLSEISSSTGEKITLDYLDKMANEVYEPNTYSPEPDAYQERYETKFLNEIKTFDRDGNLVYVFDLDYNLVGSTSMDTKRYLTQITQKDFAGNALPSYVLDYEYSGDFKGGLKSITNPKGGITSYDYFNKFTFVNNNAIAPGSDALAPNHLNAARYVNDQYSLSLDWEIADGVDYCCPEGNRQFRIVRQFWNGSQWIRNQRFIDQPIKFDEDNNNSTLDNARFVFGDDFYATLVFNRDTDLGYLYLSHLNRDGLTWTESTFSNIPVESFDDFNREEDPVLIMGEDFVAIGTNRTGRLHKYYWNGADWIHHESSYGNGQFYYEAQNNFILILDEDGGPDQITGVTHEDNYYFEYLDQERIWNRLSWSADIDPFITGIQDASFFYPNNAMSAFVADDNPEFFLRWSNNYSFLSVDNVIGFYDDRFPIVPVGNNLFTVFELFSRENYNPQKGLAFNGNSWTWVDINNGKGAGLQVNQITTQRDIGGSYTIELNQYDPNSNAWLPSVNLINTAALGTYQSEAFAFGNDLFIAGHYLYQRNNSGDVYLDQINPFLRTVAKTGSDYLYGEFRGTDPSNIVERASIYYLDKYTGNYAFQQVKDLGDPPLYNYMNRKALAFGGYSPFFSQTTYLDKDETFDRFIDNQLNQDVYDIVVNSMTLDNGHGDIRITNFNYKFPNPEPTNNTVFYGEVVTQDVGDGDDSNGVSIYTFNTGVSDLELAGSIITEEVISSSGQTKQLTSFEYTKTLPWIQNSIGSLVRQSGFVRNTVINETKYYSNGEMTNQVNINYNLNGQVTNTTTTDSRGRELKQTKIYAHTLAPFSFLEERNMLSNIGIYKETINGNSVIEKHNTWVEDIDKIYISSTSSGISTSTLRINQEITKVDDYGNIQESTKDDDIYSCVLMGQNYVNEVAVIVNASFNEIITELDVSYEALQLLDNASLEIELRKLYNRLPSSRITLNFYDSQGRIEKTVDARENATHFHYDNFGRLEFVTDDDDNVIRKTEYNSGD